MNIKNLPFVARLLCCVLLFFSTLNSQAQDLDPVSIDIECITGNTGDMVCVDFVVNSFESVTSFQFAVNFDPGLLSYTNVQESPDFPNLEDAYNDGSAGNGYILFIFSTETAVTLNTGDIVFSVCFEIVGDCGNTSPVYIDGSIISGGLEICQEDMDINQICSTIMDGQPGCVDIVCTELTAFIVACAETDDGAGDGSVTFYASGGDAPYTYELNPGSITETTPLSENQRETINGLSTANYTLVVTDNSGNTTSASVFLDVNFPVTFDLKELRNPTCFNRDNGYIEIENIMGGFAPYTIKWEPTLRNTPRIEDLPPGVYTVTVMDDGGCETSETYELTLDTLKAEVMITDSITCKGNSDGAIKVTASGGTPYFENNYGLTRNGFNLGVNGSMWNIGGLQEGIVTIRVYDSLGCYTDPIEVNMEANQNFLEALFNIDQPNCYGDFGSVAASASAVTNDGSFLFRPTKGGLDLPGVFATIGNDSMESIQPLMAGIYDVNIRHFPSQCEIDTFFEIIEPEELILDSIEVSRPSCAGADGKIAVMATGGTPIYMYEWENAETDTLREDLNGGMYSCTVVDANGCRDSLSWTFMDGGTLNIGFITTQAISCSGANDGSIQVIDNGNNSTYQWEDENGMDLGAGPEITGLSSGTYYVTVTADGCVGEDDYFLPEPTTFSATFPDPVLPSCPDTQDGTLSISLQGGNMPYEYEWYNTNDSGDPEGSPIGNQSVINGIGAGTYYISVTDLTGCVYDTTLNLDVPPALELDVNGLIDVSCFNGSDGMATATASGGGNGVTDFNYTWSTGESGTGISHTATQLEGGLNWVYADDGYCVSDTVFFNTDQPDPLVIDLAASTIEQPDCGDDCNGRAIIVGMGGNGGPHIVYWVDLDSNNPSQQNLCAGTYHIELTDINGCTNMDSIILYQVEPLEVTINESITQDINCFDNNGGTIGVNVMGGTPGTYNYFWTPNVSSGAVATGLGEGDYQIIVTDDTNCIDTVEYSLTEPIPVDAEVTTDGDINCFGESTCIRINNPSGGSGSNYTYTINNGVRFPIDSCVTVFAGEYLINVFDAEGCNFETTIDISQPAEVEVTLGEDIEIKLGLATEEITVDVFSEQGIDTLEWIPNTYLDCIDPDCFTVVSQPPSDILYRAVVTDENGCTGFDEIRVSVTDDRTLVLPNIISIGGDGYNDHFDLSFGFEVAQIKLLQVFDRWGNRVFHRENFVPVVNDPDSWDGRFNGEFVQQGVYVWYMVAEFVDGVEVDYTGDLTVIRNGE